MRYRLAGILRARRREVTANPEPAPAAARALVQIDNFENGCCHDIAHDRVCLTPQGDNDRFTLPE